MASRTDHMLRAFCCLSLLALSRRDWFVKMINGWSVECSFKSGGHIFIDRRGEDQVLWHLVHRD